MGISDLIRKNNSNLGLLVVLLVTIFLRFPYLGYSDYIGDEHKAFLEPEAGQSKVEFFLSRRKGPMQFIISEIPHAITGTFKNEFAQRVPFTIISIFAMLTFYKLVSRLTKSNIVALISALLLTVNGFILGFGRIAQYQNLNLFFSFASLYFYANLVTTKEKLVRSTLLGTLMFCLSLLSHWDAIFIIPVVAILFIKFFKDPSFDDSFKYKLVFYNFIFGCLVLLPFLIPYVFYQIGTPDNMRYFSRRIEFGHFNIVRYKLLIDLYNPFVTFWFYAVLGLVGSFFVKKSYLFTAWLIFGYLFFELFVRKPGTHIYNFLIPVTVLVAIGVVEITRKIPRLVKIVSALLTATVICFLIYQAYMIFIDHAVEYPWKQKIVLGYETRKYTVADKLPLFGFPHKRYWKEINKFVNSQGDGYGYMTNEVKTISEYYMDVEYRSDGGFYVIGVKKPLSFVNDWKLTNIKGRKKVCEILSEQGERVVRIYRVDPR